MTTFWAPFLSTFWAGMWPLFGVLAENAYYSALKVLGTGQKGSGEGQEVLKKWSKSGHFRGPPKS